MKIDKKLLSKMEGYDALLYSAMCQLKHPYNDLLKVSNEYLMGRIFELFEDELSEGLVRLEKNGYIKTFRSVNDNPQYHLKKSITTDEYLIVDSMADPTISPSERVYIAYLNDMFNSGRKWIKIEETLRILQPDAINNDEFKHWATYTLEGYNIYLTENGGYFTRREPVNSVTP